MKNNFLLYTDDIEIIEAMSSDQVKSLLLSLLRYKNDEEVDVDPELKYVYIMLRQRIDREEDAYQKKCDELKTRGKKGGRPKNLQVSEKPTGFEKTYRFSENQKVLKKPDNDNDNDNDNDTISSAVAEEYMEPPQQQPLPEISNDHDIISAWNACKLTQKIKSIPYGGTRYSNTRLCIGTDPEGFMAAIQSIDSQAWFIEQFNRGSPVKYDWFVDPNNYQKVVEGNYKAKYKSRNNGGGGYIGLERDW